MRNDLDAALAAVRPAGALDHLDDCRAQELPVSFVERSDCAGGGSGRRDDVRRVTGLQRATEMTAASIGSIRLLMSCWRLITHWHSAGTGSPRTAADNRRGRHGRSP